MKEITSQNFSLIVPEGCQADCDFCVSKSLDDRISPERTEDLDLAKLARAIRFARDAGAIATSISGGGEPTLYMDPGGYVDRALPLLAEHFAKVDLYTNGYRMERVFDQWCITHVTISLPSFTRPELYTGRFNPLETVLSDVSRLVDSGRVVRLSLILCRESDGGSEERILTYLQRALELGVHGVIVREASRYTSNEEWYEQNYLEMAPMRDAVTSRAGFEAILEMPWGTRYFDYRGLRVAFYCAEERQHVGRHVRTLCYFPDQHLYGDFIRRSSIVI